VSVGDTVSGIRILEIASDHVVCQDSQRQWVLSLAQEKKATELPKTSILNKWKTNSPSADIPAQPPTRAADDHSNIEARRSMEKSMEILKQGDALLKSPLIFERLYTKAADLCDEADRQAQNAFRLAKDEAFRVGVKKHIDRVRLAKQMILKEKADYNTRNRSLISAHQVRTGMTSRDVVSSWGAPLMQNRDGQVEKWVYQDQNGYQKEMVFKDGILIGY
jgi:hypothetical protein